MIAGEVGLAPKSKLPGTMKFDRKNCRQIDNSCGCRKVYKVVSQCRAERRRGIDFTVAFYTGFDVCVWA